MKITLLGRVPSKKNSRINTRSGRSFPSAKYTEWHKDASLQLKQFPFGGIPDHVTGISLMFYFPDLRRTDLSNKAESIMDLLVDNGYIKDDSWQHINPIHLWGAYDKDNPRVEIDY